MEKLKAEACDLFFEREGYQNRIAQINQQLVKLAQQLQEKPDDNDANDAGGIPTPADSGSNGG